MQQYISLQLGAVQNPPHLDGVGDMSALTHLEEDNVVHNLFCRYAKKEIYTYVAEILVAVNPYEQLPLYGPDIMARYRSLKRAARLSVSPHCYATAEHAYQLLAKTSVNQVARSSVSLLLFFFFFFLCEQLWHVEIYCVIVEVRRHLWGKWQR